MTRSEIVRAGEPKSSFRTDIQALRGVAVLLVVFYHAGFQYLPAGYLGVDLFFVISGFIVTSLIIKSIQSESFSVFGFYYRRAKRILPAAYVVIFVTIVLAPYFLGEIELREFVEQVVGAVTFTVNFVLWTQSDYFDGAAEGKPLLHFWSLAIEEQYYILLPVFLLVGRRSAWLRATIFIVVASFLLSLVWAAANPTAAFFLLPGRVWELGLGSLGAMLPSRYLGAPIVSLARIPALVVLVAVPMVPTGFTHPGPDAFLVCAAALVIIIGHNQSRWETVTPVRGVARIGDISYSLYLVHWPTLVFIRAAWLGEPPLWALSGGVAFSLAGSALLYMYVEEPFRRGFPAFNRRLVTGLVAASLALCAAPFVVTALHQSPVDYEYLRRTNYGFGSDCAFKGGDFEPGLAGCRSAGTPKVIVWGDSFAMALTVGLSQELAGIGLEQATSGACGPIASFAPFSVNPSSPYNRDFAEDCIEFNDKVLSYIVASPDLEVVVISSPFTAPASRSGQALVRSDGEIREVDRSPEMAAEGIHRIAEAVRAGGKRIIVVGPPPFGGFDIGVCLERKDRGQIILGPHHDCEILQSDYEKLRAQTIEFLSLLPTSDIPVFWPSDILCNGTVCRTEMAGKFLYRDSGHLSYEGSVAFARAANLGERVLVDAR